MIPLVVVLLTKFSLSDDAILLQFLTFCDIHMIHHLFSNTCYVLKVKLCHYLFNPIFIYFFAAK